MVLTENTSNTFLRQKTIIKADKLLNWAIDYLLKLNDTIPSKRWHNVVIALILLTGRSHCYVQSKKGLFSIKSFEGSEEIPILCDVDLILKAVSWLESNNKLAIDQSSAHKIYSPYLSQVVKLIFNKLDFIEEDDDYFVNRLKTSTGLRAIYGVVWAFQSVWSNSSVLVNMAHSDEDNLAFLKKSNLLDVRAFNIAKHIEVYKLDNVLLGTISNHSVYFQVLK